MMKLKSERGIILFTTLLMMTFLMALGVALLSLVTQNLRVSSFTQERQRAFYAAESGLNMALVLLSDTIKAENGGSNVAEVLRGELDIAPALSDGATYTVEVEDKSDPVAQVRLLRLKSTGHFEDANRVVETEVQVSENASLFPRDIVTSSDLDFKKYGEKDDVEFTVPDFNIIKAHYGNKVDYQQFSESVTVHKDDLDLGIYRSWKMKDDGQPETVRPLVVYIPGDLTIKNNATLRIPGNHRVDIYVGGSLDVMGTISVQGLSQNQWAVFHVKNSLHFRGKFEVGNCNPETDLARLVFLLDTTVENEDSNKKDTRVHLNGKVNASVGIYAPTRAVKINGNVSMEGSVVTDSIDISEGNVNMQYDPNLRKYRAEGYWSVEKVGTWSEQ